jgi:ribokinase
VPICEIPAVRLAVIGHVEWVQFARVPRTPPAGDIVHTTEAWEEPAGGGAVAAVELVRLNGEAAFYTALGEDALGRQARRELERLGVSLHAPHLPEPQRRAFVHVDSEGERTITVLGGKLVPKGHVHRLPWEDLAEADGVYFVSGDVEALRAAREARVLVATARELATLRESRVQLDAVVASGQDDGERYQPGDLDPPPHLVVTTAGGLGGWAQPGGPFRAAPIPGPVEDAYGCGDCFAAGLTVALADGLPTEDALAFAARCGAAALTRRGAHGGPRVV